MYIYRVSGSHSGGNEYAVKSYHVSANGLEEAKQKVREICSSEYEIHSIERLFELDG